MSVSRTCVVTGATSGIGRSVAARLVASGHRVALVGRDEGRLEEAQAEFGPECLTIRRDLADAGASEDLFEIVEEEFGTVEVLVAAAGVAESAPLAKTSDESWTRHLRVNLTAPFEAMRRCTPSMCEQGWGRVIVISSRAGMEGSPYVAAYTASKHGVLGLVRSAASELSGSGVTVNAICPGYVDSPMTDQTVERIVDKTGRDPESVRKHLAGLQGHGRLIAPDEIASAVQFLMDAESINSQCIVMDGGPAT